MEVSALGVLYGWDDGVLRASPHYLGDLVDYARRAATPEPPADAQACRRRARKAAARSRLVQSRK